MNIFALHDSPYRSAQLQHDKHVVKMVLESAQLLSGALRLNPDWQNVLDPFDHSRTLVSTGSLYKVTHAHHPCARWARRNRANFRWLAKHALGLSEEYTYRFHKRHKSDYLLQLAFHAELPDDGEAQTPFAQAMPEKYKTDDAVLSYRLYYINEKVTPDSKWTFRRGSLPDWLLVPAVTTTE